MRSRVLCSLQSLRVDSWLWASSVATHRPRWGRRAFTDGVDLEECKCKLRIEEVGRGGGSRRPPVCSFIVIPDDGVILPPDGGGGRRWSSFLYITSWAMSATAEAGGWLLDEYWLSLTILCPPHSSEQQPTMIFKFASLYPSLQFFLLFQSLSRLPPPPLETKTRCMVFLRKSFLRESTRQQVFATYKKLNE